jgi:hypothetical protein
VSFAEGTSVPVERSRAEIERLVSRYGASEFSSGWSGGLAMIQFMAKGRRVRFVLELPDEAWGRKNRGRRQKAVADLVDAEGRRRWRCLLLAIKAKLEVVESGIASFDEEFLAHIVVDDRTVFDRIREASASGRPMLPPVGS